jgi:hypothetical protein
MRNRRLVTFKRIVHNSAGIEWKSPVLTARYRFHTFIAKNPFLTTTEYRDMGQE